MPANDEFPRGWTTTVIGAAGALTSIAIPAVPGIAHVLTSVVAKIVNTSGVIVAADLTVNGVTIAQLRAAAANPSFDDISRDFKIMGVLGAAMTVSFGGSAAGMAEHLTIQGYDV